ncbi:MAG TPA: hypothetical protein DCX95_04515 [Elusimicrobia bacterium]|nr:hypothetical protein [Elusimicrobiota bacterium]
METVVTEKEFAVISELANNHLLNQRSIAEKLGISLGLTNLILKRLAKMGYIKVKQVNRRNIRYLLTPKGFSEKAKKSYNYTIRTVNALSLISNKIRNLILEKYKTGVKSFFIIGDNELADLSEIAFKKLAVGDIKYCRKEKNVQPVDENALLLYTIKNRVDKNSVNLISYLAEQGLDEYTEKH